MKPEEIRNIRKKLGLTLEAFAHKLGVSYITICRWEKGHADPSPLALSKLRHFVWENKDALH